MKARPGGAHYVYSIITGFHEKKPGDFKVLPNKYFNPYFAGWNISMPPPLADNQVTFSDGTKATIDQEAHDVVTFLSWASEPTLDARHRTGVRVFLFLIVGVGIFYAAKRKIWAAVH